MGICNNSSLNSTLISIADSPCNIPARGDGKKVIVTKRKLMKDLVNGSMVNLPGNTYSISVQSSIMDDHQISPWISHTDNQNLDCELDIIQPFAKNFLRSPSERSSPSQPHSKPTLAANVQAAVAAYATQKKQHEVVEIFLEALKSSSSQHLVPSEVPLQALKNFPLEYQQKLLPLLSTLCLKIDQQSQLYAIMASIRVLPTDELFSLLSIANPLFENSSDGFTRAMTLITLFLIPQEQRWEMIPHIIDLFNGIENEKKREEVLYLIQNIPEANRGTLIKEVGITKYQIYFNNIHINLQACILCILQQLPENQRNAMAPKITLLFDLMTDEEGRSVEEDRLKVVAALIALENEEISAIANYLPLVINSTPIAADMLVHMIKQLSTLFNVVAKDHTRMNTMISQINTIDLDMHHMRIDFTILLALCPENRQSIAYQYIFSLIEALSSEQEKYEENIKKVIDICQKLPKHQIDSFLKAEIAVKEI